MKYMGSKARHAKELLPIILANRIEGQWYVEPFVGGANMIDKIKCDKIIGTNKIRFAIATKSPAPEAIQPINII